jgi:hypothetical protein
VPLHRFQHLFASSVDTQDVASPARPGFVLYPLVLVQAFSPAQPTGIHAVYLLALEQALEQARPSARSREIRFSDN